MDKGAHDEVKTRYEGSFWNFSDKNASEIQHEIRITRADLDETVNALQARLAPQQMFNQFVDMARDNLRANAPRMADVVRQNPMPSALVAVGLGWLFYRTMNPAPPRRLGSYYEGYGSEEYGLGPEGQFSATEQTDISGGMMESAKGWTSEAAQKVKSSTSRMKDQAREKANQMAGSAREKAGHLAESAREKASHFAESAREKASNVVDYTKGKMGYLAGTTRHKAGDLADYTMGKAGEMAQATKQGIQTLGHSTRVQVSRAGQSSYETIRENPLAFAIACVGIGAAVALSLPSTRKERELMGPASDNLVEKAKETGQEAWEKVEHVVQAGQEAATEQARREEII